jgi:hypothetical protein
MCPITQKFPSYGFVSLLASFVERSPPTIKFGFGLFTAASTSGPYIDNGAVTQKKAHGVDVIEPGSEVQGSLSHIVSGVHISSVGDEQLCDSARDAADGGV